MSLRPTPRRSGGMHATVRIPFYPGRETIIDVIADGFWQDRDSEPALTKARVEEAVRGWYSSHGGETEISVGDALMEMDDEERTEAAEWAEEQLMRLWPEWVK